LSERQLRNYIRKADAVTIASVKEKRSKVIRRHLARREHMYGKAMNAGDIRTALAVAQDDAKLRNLYPPKRTELTGKDGAPLAAVVANVEMTDDERAAAVTNLLARVGASDAGPNPPAAPDAPGPAVGGPGPADEPGPDEAGPVADSVPPLFG